MPNVKKCFPPAKTERSAAEVAESEEDSDDESASSESEAEVLPAEDKA